MSVCCKYVFDCSFASCQCSDTQKTVGCSSFFLHFGCCRSCRISQRCCGLDQSTALFVKIVLSSIHLHGYLDWYWYSHLLSLLSMAPGRAGAAVLTWEEAALLRWHLVSPFMLPVMWLITLTSDSRHLWPEAAGAATVTTAHSLVPILPPIGARRVCSWSTDVLMNLHPRVLMYCIMSDTSISPANIEVTKQI